MRLPFAHNRVIRRVLRTSTDILTKLPNRGDGLITTAVKSLSIYESVLKYLNMEEGGTLQDIIYRLGGTESQVNDALVQLFFSTPIQNHFSITSIPINEYTEIVVAKSGQYGTLFFIEWRWGPTPEHSNQLWYTKGFDFKAFMGNVWSRFHQAIHVDFRETPQGMRACFGTVEWAKFDLTPSSTKRFEQFVAQHQCYQRDKVPRTYLFRGTQGTGKTTFALRSIRVLGGTVLRLSALGLTHTKTNELDFLLESLNPNFFLVDDLDKVSLNEVLPKLLTVLAEFKVRRPTLTTFLTANKTEFDPALIRPERVDEILDFKAPDLNERYELLRRAAPEGVPDATLHCLAKHAEGLTAPYLNEAGLQLRYRTPYAVSDLIWRMTQTMGVKSDKGSDKDPSTTTPDAAK